MSRIVRFHQFGGPEVLRIEEAEPVEPGRGEVRMRIGAIGINRADILMRSGKYIETPVLPAGLGLEAAGVIDAIGPAVRDLAPGDVVSLIPPLSMACWPVYGELQVFPARHVIRHPPEIDLVTAAASWMQYLTAYGGLVELAGLAPGEPVLITAASSSVGLAAIQIANIIGAIPVAVTRTAQKRPALLAAGARYVLVSDTPRFAESLRTAAGPGGFRVVFDPVAGPGFEPIVDAMATGGILIEYGGLSPRPTPFPVGPVLAKSLTLRGYLVHEIITDAARLKRAKAFVLSGLQSGRLTPRIARVFPFEQIADAHAFLERNEHLGKVVVTLP